MLESFILKRNCKLNAHFFSFLLKKLPWLKATFQNKGKELMKKEGVRPAQLRILDKLLKSINKGIQIKKEHE